MQVFRRGSTVPSRLLQRRDTWLSLGAFAEQQQRHQQDAWKTLRERAHAVQATLEKKQQQREVSVNWTAWEGRIAHKELLNCLKNFYSSQIKLLEEAADTTLDDSKKGLENVQTAAAAKGWGLYEEAIKDCEKAVERSEEVLADGATALWLSHRNPPVSAVDTNEWLDSDQYWQAFVEKQHFYSQYTPGSADPESPQELEQFKTSWNVRMAKFNERSDTPMLYDYMNQLPSWEYYDIHRSAFLEHMLYFLIRTGGDYRFFPQIPPWQWVAHIEHLRYRYFLVAQRRRRTLQLEGLERERALDLLPVDVAHDGQAAVLKLLQREAAMYRFAVARLMGHYMFLCDPFVPIQSQQELVNALQVEDGGLKTGKIYTLGKDVHALFYLPSASAQKMAPQTLPSKTENSADATFSSFDRPLTGVNRLLNHLALTGRRFNPSYAELLQIHAELLEMRGPHWFTSAGECASQAFLRRLRTDDPNYSLYVSYFREMYERFKTATEVTSASALEELLHEVSTAATAEKEAYVSALPMLLDPSIQPATESQQHEAHAMNLLQQKQQTSHHDLQNALNEGLLVAAAPDDSATAAAGRAAPATDSKAKMHEKRLFEDKAMIRVTSAEEVIRSLAAFEKQQDEISDILKTPTR